MNWGAAEMESGGGGRLIPVAGRREAGCARGVGRGQTTGSFTSHGGKGFYFIFYFRAILSAIEHHWMVLTKVIKQYDLISSFKIHLVLWKMD